MQHSAPNTLTSVSSRGRSSVVGDAKLRMDDKEQGFKEEKYKKLKRKLKEVMEQNEKISADLDRAQKKIRGLRKEKNILLDKIAKLEDTDSLSSDDDSSVLFDSDVESEPSQESSRLSRRATSPHANSSIPHKRRAILPLAAMTSRKATVPLPTVTASTGSRSKKIIPGRERKMHTQPSKPRRVLPIDRDDLGNYKLPVQVGILTVKRLGHIIWDREAFHNDRYIWPVGFTVSRSYPSMIDPNRNTNVTCRVTDGVDSPRFEIQADDAPDQPIVANTATGAWTTVVRRANEVRRRDHSNSASGPDYFGFTHPTIAKMIQDLPGAEKCRNYVWQEFEVMPTKTAMGVNAAAEKKKANLERMGSANKRPSHALSGFGSPDSTIISVKGDQSSVSPSGNGIKRSGSSSEELASDQENLTGLIAEEAVRGSASPSEASFAEEEGRQAGREEIDELAAEEDDYDMEEGF